MTIIKRLSVVLLEEIRNLKAKPKATPMTKQINIFANGQAISANDNAVSPVPFVPTKMEIEIVYKSKEIILSTARTSKRVVT